VKTKWKEIYPRKVCTLSLQRASYRAHVLSSDAKDQIFLKRSFIFFAEVHRERVRSKFYKRFLKPVFVNFAQQSQTTW